jgi:hypothetical protein
VLKALGDPYLRRFTGPELLRFFSFDPTEFRVKLK